MEETNYCQYLDNICNNSECSVCSTYFKYKQKMEDMYKKKKVIKDETHTAVLSSVKK